MSEIAVQRVCLLVKGTLPAGCESEYLTLGSCMQAPEVFRILPGAQTAPASASAAHAVVSPQQEGTAPSDGSTKGSGRAHDSAYCAKADCWSAAVFVYEVLCGTAPFGHIRDRQALEHAILHAPILPPSQVSEPAAQFLMAALDRTPETRMSIMEMLCHPWLVSVAAVERKGPTLLASSKPGLPAAAAASAPGNHTYSRFLPERNDSPRTVIGFAAPRGASSLAGPCLQGITNPGIMAAPPAQDQESSLQSSSDSSVPSFFQAPVAAAREVVKKPYATFEVATSPSTRPGRTSEALRKCASASSCTLKYHEHNGSCGTVKSRISTSTSALPMPTSSLTLALLDQNVSSNRNSTCSHHSTEYSHSPTSSVQRGDCMPPVLLDGRQDAPRSLPRSNNSGAAPVAKVTIVYAAGEQGKTCSPASALGATPLPCISEAALEREALEAGRTANGSPCTDADCFNPTICASAGRCNGNLLSQAPHGVTCAASVSLVVDETDVQIVETPAELPAPAAYSVGQTAEECNDTMPWKLKPVATITAGIVDKSGSTLEPEGRDIVSGCSPDEDRTFEVRGSWGGSVDSTAGAAVARMMDRFRNCAFKQTSANTSRRVSEQSDMSAWEFPWGGGLSKNLCASCSAEFGELNVLTEEEQPVDDCCHSCLEKCRAASVAACSELQPGSELCGDGQDNNAKSQQLLPALDLVSATELSAQAISIVPQHLEVQEHATGSLAMPETLGAYGDWHSSSSASRLAGSGEKPAAHACADSRCCAAKSSRVSAAPAGALSQALSGAEGLKSTSVATAWQASSSRQSLHVRTENTPSQDQLGVLRASPVYTEETRASSTVEGSVPT